MPAFCLAVGVPVHRQGHPLQQRSMLLVGSALSLDRPGSAGPALVDGAGRLVVVGRH